MPYTDEDRGCHGPVTTHPCGTVQQTSTLCSSRRSAKDATSAAGDKRIVTHAFMYWSALHANHFHRHGWQGRRQSTAAAGGVRGGVPSLASAALGRAWARNGQGRLESPIGMLLRRHACLGGICALLVARPIPLPPALALDTTALLASSAYEPDLPDGAAGLVPQLPATPHRVRRGPLRHAAASHDSTSARRGCSRAFDSGAIPPAPQVLDLQGWLSPPELDRLERILGRLEADTGYQLLVLTQDRARARAPDLRALLQWCAPRPFSRPAALSTRDEHSAQSLRSHP